MCYETTALNMDVAVARKAPRGNIVLDRVFRQGCVNREVVVVVVVVVADAGHRLCKTRRYEPRGPR